MARFFSVCGAYISVSSCFAALATPSEGSAGVQTTAFFCLLTPDLRRMLLDLLALTKLV